MLAFRECCYKWEVIRALDTVKKFLECCCFLNEKPLGFVVRKHEQQRCARTVSRHLSGPVHVTQPNRWINPPPLHSTTLNPPPQRFHTLPPQRLHTMKWCIHSFIWYSCLSFRKFFITLSEGLVHGLMNWVTSFNEPHVEFTLFVASLFGR